MEIGNRTLGTIFSALGERRHYVAGRNMIRVYRDPLDAFKRYILGHGEYPADIVVNTPNGPLALTLYSHHDILTVNEIFCRLDYPAKAQDRVIVDFGSNIGISAAYFLTAAPEACIYLYEPLRANVDRLRHNLKAFEERYHLHEVAIGTTDGNVEFGWEETGRYGGVGLQTGRYVSVTCLDSNKVLENIIAQHSRIDILKIDIETLEKQVVERIPVDVAKSINRIYVEYYFDTNPLAETHSYRQYGSVAQFTRNTLSASIR